MNAQVSPPGPAPVTSLHDLAPVATHALRLIRMWSWGAVHRETLRLAAATQFGQAQGVCVVGAFESLFAQLETAARPRLVIRQPDSGKLGDDELWFLGLVDAAAAGAHALPPLAAGRVVPGTEARLAESLHGFVRVLTDCLAQKARPATSACPIACPMHTDCAGRPKLEVVK